jgi:uncharacterized protein (DUF2336 family)
METIKQLAWNETIAVAGQVLTVSRRLTTDDLTEIARVRGQAHLVAISKREMLETPVTDVLLRRGDREVIQTLATNAGARFSDTGYAALVEKADGDEILSEAVGAREDIPPRLLRDLLARATDAVRAKLLALLPPEKREQLSQIISTLSNAMKGATRDGKYVEAEKTVQRLQQQGRLTDETIQGFAREGHLLEVIVAVAVLTSSKIDVISEVLTGVRNDAVLVPCKAADLSWQTVETVLRTRNQPISEQIVELAKSDYKRLSVETAQKTLRFLQVRATVVK